MCFFLNLEWACGHSSPEKKFRQCDDSKAGINCVTYFGAMLNHYQCSVCDPNHIGEPLRPLSREAAWSTYESALNYALNFPSYADWIAQTPAEKSIDPDNYRAHEDEAWEQSAAALEMAMNWNDHDVYTMELNVPTDATVRATDLGAAFHEMLRMVEDSQARRTQAIAEVEQFFSRSEQAYATVEEPQIRGEQIQLEEEKVQHQVEQAWREVERVHTLVKDERDPSVVDAILMPMNEVQINDLANYEAKHIDGE